MTTTIRDSRTVQAGRLRVAEKHIEFIPHQAGHYNIERSHEDADPPIWRKVWSGYAAAGEIVTLPRNRRTYYYHIWGTVDANL